MQRLFMTLPIVLRTVCFGTEGALEGFERTNEGLEPIRRLTRGGSPAATAPTAVAEWCRSKGSEGVARTVGVSGTSGAIAGVRSANRTCGRLVADGSPRSIIGVGEAAERAVKARGNSR